MARPRSRPSRRGPNPPRPHGEPARKRPDLAEQPGSLSPIPEPAQASPELIARLSRAHLIDDEDRRALLRVGVLGATPGTVLALRSLVDTLRLSLAVDAEQQVDEDWDRVFGGAFTGTPRARALRRDLAPLIPLPHLHLQGDVDVALVSADRVVDPGIPFDLTVRDVPHLIVTRGEHSYEIRPLRHPGRHPLLPVL